MHGVSPQHAKGITVPLSSAFPLGIYLITGIPSAQPILFPQQGVFFPFMLSRFLLHNLQPCGTPRAPFQSVLSPNVGTKFLSVWPYHTRLYPSMKPPEQLPFYDPFATCDPTPSMYSRPSMARFVLRAARGQINPHV